MREIRTYGSEGGEAPQGAFPTLIQDIAIRAVKNAKLVLGVPRI